MVESFIVSFLIFSALAVSTSPFLDVLLDIRQPDFSEGVDRLIGHSVCKGGERAVQRVVINALSGLYLQANSWLTSRSPLIPVL